ncbi:hypothetical protein HRbin17_02192 [bacterium HR17]|jgi:hypothetical protein|uniref:Vitamin K epoxide reductase domain-containing protein n=1 Tax=Candidatus Fervidibacter japonicus TaxID=2035412 RepID=A0A2H5XEP9_9BACT|nr:hypothetical protein HRbin17_02192 [bacterium HR17]
MLWIRFLPLAVFALVISAHVVYASRTTQVNQKVICVLDEQGNCVEDKVIRTTSTVLSRDGFRRYLQHQDYFLGFAYALAFAFAAYALMHWRYNRKRAVAGAAFGVGLGSALWTGTCFLVGCCGSPMLSVWLGLFGAKALGLTKPLVALVTALSVGCGFLWLRRQSCCPDCCQRQEVKSDVAR